VALAAALASLALLATGAIAGSVGVSIQGNNVTYSASGLPPDSNVVVEIRNDTTGSSTTQGPFETGATGTLPSSSGGTGDDIAPGTTVTVTIRRVPEGNVVAQGSATKPQPPVTAGDVVRWIGTLIRWLS
jgi:hypothetical protein